MIERLVVALRYFAEGETDGNRGGEDGSEQTSRRAAGDYLDAYRLIVDCPQYELGAAARAALADVERLADLLERPQRSAERERTMSETREAARNALVALGTRPG